MDNATNTGRRVHTPGGDVVTIDAPGYDMGEPWFASVRIRTERPYAGLAVGLQLRELHIAPAGNYDRVIAHVLDGRIVERVQAQGGHFLVAHSRTADRGLALWRGPWHEAATWLPEIASTSRALRYFDQLMFTDRPGGLGVGTRRGSPERVEVIEMSKRIPNIGVLDIKQAVTALDLVPAWSGARVPTGEVWRLGAAATVDHGATAPTQLLHATESTVTVLSGDGENYHREEPRLRFLKELRHISWFAGPAETSV